MPKKLHAQTARTRSRFGPDNQVVRTALIVADIINASTDGHNYITGEMYRKHCAFIEANQLPKDLEENA